MSKSLIIVESPSKAKTIKKYLGNHYNVEASSGHLIDLPPSKLGVDVDKDFKPNYVVIKGKNKFLSKLAKAAENADNVYLASDPDREGEAIAWHIVNRLKLRDRAYRVLIYEITEKGVLDSLKHPTNLSQDRFEAQQARRILDRLVGYQVSPILWRKVKRGLSAGRVQSVALRMIVEREREIESFKPEEYWTVESKLQKLIDGHNGSFQAILHTYDGERIKIGDEEEAKRVVDSIKGERFTVSSIARKERIRKTLPPFITSTLQQEASRKLRFPVKKTMSVAQKLYEGIELGDEGPMGLITYMRTDSVRISEHAIGEARSYIKNTYGGEYVPKKPNVFKVKKSAQDAHEAIRPTVVIKTPDSIASFLTEDQLQLYKLIWNRFIASQMNPAIYDQTTVDINAGAGVFRATGSIIKFPGFGIVYREGKEEEEEKDSEEDKKLPELLVGEDLRVLELDGKQHFTQPAPRYTESSLVKELEEKGIGRPSTYAAILSTIQEREYVLKEKTKLKPTALGRSVSDLLIEGFPEIMDIKFTAEMEEKLDEVEEGKAYWVDILKGFYRGFSSRLDKAESSMRSLRKEGIPTDIDCSLCGAKMLIKWGKRGEFLSCSRYPECKNAKKFVYGSDGEIKIIQRVTPEVMHDIVCDLCGKPMAVRTSRYGKFLGCTGYPDCKNVKRIDDLNKDFVAGGKSHEKEEERQLKRKII
jgi:DNA topoisomerase-1